MQLHRESAEIWVRGAGQAELELPRTTHLGIGAHPDDLEILAIHGILECFQRRERAFTGVVVTDGAGSARDAEYAAFSDEQMRAIRREEQKKAAQVGDYAAQILLDYTSAAVKDPAETRVVEDLVQLLRITRPQVVYTHNLCDQHETHVAVALRTLAALRQLPEAERPIQVLGCEVWRDLDWLPHPYRIALDVSARESLQRALLGVFDSQIVGGKRYDEATLGRRRAHATFSESHAVDRAQGVVFGMDLTPLVKQSDLDPMDYARACVTAFQQDVQERLKRLV